MGNATWNGIGICNPTTTCEDGVVDTNLANDVMQSVKPWVEELLENDYRILFYSGQLDLTIPYASSLEFIKVH